MSLDPSKFQNYEVRATSSNTSADDSRTLPFSHPDKRRWLPSAFPSPRRASRLMSMIADRFPLSLNAHSDKCRWLPTAFPILVARSDKYRWSRPSPSPLHRCNAIALKASPIAPSLVEEWATAGSHLSEEGTPHQGCAESALRRLSGEGANYTEDLELSGMDFSTCVYPDPPLPPKIKRALLLTCCCYVELAPALEASPTTQYTRSPPWPRKLARFRILKMKHLLL